MAIYEFVTPSDPITFKAEDDKIAFFCSLILGNGKAGCNNTETDESVGSLLLFCKDPDKIIEDKLECDPGEFSEKNRPKILECFRSFAYGSVRDRKTYDSAINAITDKGKLMEFKKAHEDENKTSMSKWVLSAWQYADSLVKSPATVNGETK